MGVFHLPKDSWKFRKLRWEMFIREGRVPFDTLVPHSFPGSLHHEMYFPPKYKMAAQLLLIVERNASLFLWKKSLFDSDDDDIPILAAVATYMRRNLHRNKVFMKIVCVHIRSMNLKTTSG